MLTQKVSTIDELLQFVSTLRQKHGVRLWFRGEENADLTLIPSIQRSQKRLGINFIKNCIIKPFCHILAPSLFFMSPVKNVFRILSFTIPQNGYLYNYEKTSIIK